ITINSAIAGNAGLVKTGPGKLVINGATSYTGKTFMYGGTLAIGSAVVTNQLTLSGTLIFLGGSATGVSSGVILGGNSNLDTNGNNATIGGGISSGPNSFGLTKQGNGILTLNGASTYMGATTVRGGSLVLTGSIVSDTASLIRVGDTASANGFLVI